MKKSGDRFLTRRQRGMPGPLREPPQEAPPPPLRTAGSRKARQPWADEAMKGEGQNTQQNSERNQAHDLAHELATATQRAGLQLTTTRAMSPAR